MIKINHQRVFEKKKIKEFFKEMTMRKLKKLVFLCIKCIIVCTDKTIYGFKNTIQFSIIETKLCLVEKLCLEPYTTIIKYNEPKDNPSGKL